MGLRKFVAPEYVFGIGARNLAGQYAKKLGARKILVVTDPGVIAAGWTGDVIAAIEQEDLPYVTFSAVSANPRAEEVMTGAEFFAAHECNLIVAVGGGSPIDCAKGIGIVSSHKRNILEFEGVDMVTSPIPPLICIPTTGGTSADVSQFAIITNRQEKVKIAIISKAVVPDLALIDPETLSSMSPYLTACTGMDALTHAIEAFVSNAHSPMTDIHALEAIRLLSQHLIPSVRNPGDLEFRSKVMLASLQAGLAFSNAILGATHAMAHSLGGYLDLPHGECNAILLDHVVSYNISSTPERFDAIAQALSLDLRGLTSSEREKALLKKLRDIKQTVGIDRHLGELGVNRTDLPQLSRHALADACLVTNPRTASLRDLETIYEEAL
jgi:alcohol dehydrogenase class IV